MTGLFADLTHAVPRYEKIPGLGKLDKMSVSEQYVSRAKVRRSFVWDKCPPRQGLINVSLGPIFLPAARAEPCRSAFVNTPRVAAV